MNLKFLGKIRKKFAVDFEEVKKHSSVYENLLVDKDILNEEFFFQGNNNEAIILVHGWSSTPYTIRKLGEYLNKKGYTVIGPRLTGHGTKPEDLDGVIWQDWLNDLGRVYKKTAQHYDKIFIAGTSLGGNLAILLAERHSKIRGLILLATPYKTKSKIKTIILIKLIKLLRIKYLNKYYPAKVKTLGTAITPMVSYQRYPVNSVEESMKCVSASRKIMQSIEQPCFILQSKEDHMINSDSAEKIYNKISSKVKKKKYLKNTYHSFISDVNSQYVFKDIYNFMEKI